MYLEIGLKYEQKTKSLLTERLIKGIKNKRLCNNAHLRYVLCTLLQLYIITFNAGGLWQKVRKRDGMFFLSLPFFQKRPKRRTKNFGIVGNLTDPWLNPGTVLFCPALIRKLLPL